MSNVSKLITNHPLVGSWGSTEGDSNAEFTVPATGTSFAVSGRDRGDGEAFVISAVSWDGERLTFSSLMPSTGHRARHVVRASSDGRTMEHELTLIEQWERVKR